MKKALFIILITILLVLILVYFYNQKETILNKKYINKKDNIYIEYPFFNDYNIDKYINNYLNKYINNYNNYLFIDYDYSSNNDNYILTFYIYNENNRIEKNNTNTFKIDLLNSTITTSKEINNYKEYDIYYQKIIDKNNKLIALTFDDGPNHNTNRVLDILKKYNIKATFFLIGRNIKGNENIIKKMNELNMEIGNHTYSHKLLTTQKEKTIKEEIDKTDTIIYNIINKKPIFIRPSYGTYNNKIKKIINRPIITWSIDPEDWKYHNSKRIYNSVINKVNDGDIILLHDIYNATANSLELIIPKLLNDGYQFVTISELLYNKNIPIIKNKVYNKIKSSS